MPQNSKACISLQAKTIQEFQEKIQTLPKEIELVEIRFDYLQNPSVENLEELKAFILNIKSENLNSPLLAKGWQPQADGVVFPQFILTSRMQKYGGELENDFEKWKEIILKAIDLEFDFVDIDLDLAEKVSEFLIPEKPKKFVKKKTALAKPDRKTKIIISYHNFEKTPSYRNLRTLSKKMRRFFPDIYKFATKIRNQKDEQNLFRILLNKKQDEELVTVGMGSLGKNSRILSPILGAKFSFVSLNQDQSTAPGQITFEEFRKAADFL